MDFTFIDKQADKKAQNNSLQSALQGINQDFKEQHIASQAKQQSFGYVNFMMTPINPDYLRMIPQPRAVEAQAVVYFRLGMKIRIGAVDPSNTVLLNIKKTFEEEEYIVSIDMTSEESLQYALRLYELHNIKQEKELKNTVDENMLQEYEKEIQNLALLKDKIDSLPALEALNMLLVGAYKTNASDIHIDPEETEVAIRFRIDGVIQNIFTLEQKTYEKIMSQIKYDAKMKMNVKNIPQDGRLSFLINNNSVDVRVSTLPTSFGETIVLRLLHSSHETISFESLGYRKNVVESLYKTLKKSQGMLLVTGPTGSGKSTTLYAALERLKKPENKIITLEDPIEYHIDGITQSQINEKEGYDFASGLRAVLRQDPDIIMVGEIRDLETAQIASQAALTGHIVLSTLHTNNAVDSIARLLNMGMKSYMLAPAINGVIAQRLARKVCEHCKIPRKLNENELQEVLKIFELFPEEKRELPEYIFETNPQGCEFCSHSGYKGRISVVEFLCITDHLKELIFEGVSEEKLFKAAREGNFMNMREYGILQILDGYTTFSEIDRVAST